MLLSLMNQLFRCYGLYGNLRADHVVIFMFHRNIIRYCVTESRRMEFNASNTCTGLHSAMLKTVKPVIAGSFDAPGKHS